MEQLSRADRVARGKDARAAAPLESHAEFSPAGKRDPVGLLLSQAKSRVPELVPVRHGRMLVSPFTFYRGAALPMAADLALTPASGLRVQLCGDAHLSNFGAFASPERRLVFDVNDFDETLPGPFEWDVKRLAASLAVAGRDSGFPAKARRKIALAAGEGYRTAMRGFADQTFMDVWYAHVDIEPVVAEFRSQMKAKSYKEAQKMLAKARMLVFFLAFAVFFWKYFSCSRVATLCQFLAMVVVSRRAYQTSRSPMAANSEMALRYCATVLMTMERRSLALKPCCRPATARLAARRLRSHSHGPGRVSSKSLTSKTSSRSGEAYQPKFSRCASPQACTCRPEVGMVARSAAMTAAAPR